MDFCNICENEEHYKDGEIRIYNSYWCELITVKIKFCPLCGKNAHMVPTTMRCSELYGNIERPAEKIWPA
jgi:hypothetical protein